MVPNKFVFLIKPRLKKNFVNVNFIGIKKYVACFFLFYIFSIKLLNFNIFNISNTSLFIFSFLYKKKDLLTYFFNFLYLKLKGFNQGFFLDLE